MAQQKFPATDIKGLTPAIDPASSDQQFVLRGRNYSFDSRGPKSSFGNRLLLPHPRIRGAYAQGFRLDLRKGRQTFTIDGDGLFVWDESVGGWRTIYGTTDAMLSPYRWTHGYLADIVFMCHPALGLLVYDPATGICQPHSDVGIATPDAAVACVVNNGRLCVLTSQVMAWSVASNGLDFTPTLGGAGFQFLSDRVSGEAITITGYSGGTLCWTTGGVLRSDFTGDAAVYRHRSLDTEYFPASSFCWTRVDDDTTLILDERGLFQVASGVVTPFAPAFNEFLIGFIQQNHLTVGENLRLDWDEQQRNLFVSISLEYGSPLYTRTFVLYEPLDKWGEFSEPHYGIIPIQVDHSERAGQYYGFMDSEFRVRYWVPFQSRELHLADSDFLTANLYYPVIQAETRYSPEAPGTLVASHGKLSGFDTTGIAGRAGYYAPGSGRPMVPQVEGLDSEILIGLFRPLGPDSSDQMSEIQAILVRMILATNDFSSHNLTQLDWQLEILASLDGTSDFETAMPIVVSSTPGSRYYACSVVGVWHAVRLIADAVGESYHLQTLELTAANAGRLL